MLVKEFITPQGKVYPQGRAMKLLGIARPTFYDWVKKGKVKRYRVKGKYGAKDRWGVAESEIRRVSVMPKWKRK